MDQHPDLLPPILSTIPHFTLHISDSIKKSNSNYKAESDEQIELDESMVVRPSINIHISYQDTNEEENEHNVCISNSGVEILVTSDEKKSIDTLKDSEDRVEINRSSAGRMDERSGIGFFEMEQQSSNSQESEKNKKQNFKKIGRFAVGSLLIIVLCLLLTQFILFFMTKTPSYSQKRLFRYVADNLGEEIITDVVFSNSCPLGYTSEKLFNWEGSRSTCFRPEQGKFEGEQCENKNFMDNIQVSSTPMINFYSWKGNQICVKKSSSFYLLTDPRKTCKQGYKHCLMRYCLPVDSECPINSMFIISTDSRSSPPPSHELIFSSEQENVYVGRIEKYTEPYVNFKTYFDYPCYDKNEQPPRPNNYNYPLYNTNYSPCSTGIDLINIGNLGIGQSLDFQKERHFYLGNHFGEEGARLPYFFENIERNYVFLHGIKRFQINYDNICTQISQNVDIVYNFPEKVINSVFGFICICIITCSLILAYFILRDYYEPGKLKDYLEYMQSHKTIFDIICLSLIAIQSVLIIIGELHLEYGGGFDKKLSKNLDNFQQNIKHSCLTDPKIKNEMEDINSNSASYLNHVCVISLLLFIVHMIVLNGIGIFFLIKKCFLRGVIEKI